jgi:hypothetical protein
MDNQRSDDSTEEAILAASCVSPQAMAVAERRQEKGEAD